MVTKLRPQNTTWSYNKYSFFRYLQSALCAKNDIDNKLNKGDRPKGRVRPKSINDQLFGAENAENFEK